MLSSAKKMREKSLQLISFVFFVLFNLNTDLTSQFLKLVSICFLNEINYLDFRIF